MLQCSYIFNKENKVTLQQIVRNRQITTGLAVPQL